MTQGCNQALGKGLRPGRERSPWENDRFDGDHRHRPHKACQTCGTSLHCGGSKRSGFCRICKPEKYKRVMTRRKRKEVDDD